MDDSWDLYQALARRAEEVNAIEHDRFNERAFKGARKEVRAFWNMVNHFTMTEDYAVEFLQDVFYLLLKGDPQLRSIYDMKPTHIPNHVMVEAFSTYDELQQLRTHTANHLISTVMAELSMETEIEDAFKAMKSARELAKHLEELLEELREYAQESRDAGEAGEDTTGIEAAFNSTSQLAEQVMADLQGQASQAAEGMGVALRAAARSASLEGDRDAELVRAFGTDPGVFQRLPFKERAALMERLRKNRIAEFARLIGGFQNVADAAWRKRVVGVPDEVSNVVLGDDLTRLTPTEMGNLALPGTRLDFFQRYTSKRLVQYEVRGKERQGLGPMVLVCDESGSMTAPCGGATREAWAKAFCLALVTLARKAGRPVYYIGYASRWQQRSIDMTEPSLEAVLEMTEGFLGGGTYYEGPLMQALDVVEGHQDKRYRRADVVFISDDEYYGVNEVFYDGWKLRRSQLSVVVHGILMGATDTGMMASLCDSMRSIADVLPGQELEHGGDVLGLVL